MPQADAIAGRFEIECEARTGGMGTVYRALDLTTGAKCAVKVLQGHELSDVERFDREAAVLAELHHPAIVRYLAHGRTQSGSRYLAMEWLEGEDLADRLDRDGLTMADSVAMARRAAEGLAYAHARGIVHRDIKPPNLFLPGGDIENVKLLDFGIARVSREGNARRLTRTGIAMGTPGYMAPEQVQGKKDIDARADVFALGCVLFECLTRVPAFEGDDVMALLAKILLQDAPRVKEFLPEVPEALDALVARMLAKDLAIRPRDGQAVAQALSALEDQVGGQAAKSQRRRAPQLTANELRMVCVVLAGGEQPRELAGAEGRALARKLREEAEGHGGHMETLSNGSLVVAVPQGGQATDQAARAARCALAMHRVAPTLPLVVATGRGIRSARAIVGEVIDRSVRFLRDTAPGTVRVCEVTAGLLDFRFEVRREEDTMLLTAERDVYDATPLLLGKPTACVGRGRELTVLADLYSGCTSEGEATAVLLTAPAGAGKSRLRREFLDWVQRRGDNVEVLLSAGDSLGAGAPFGLIGQALRRSAGIHDGEPLVQKREKLQARVARHLPAASAVETAAFLGEMANVPFTEVEVPALKAARQNPMMMGDSMRAAWEDWLLAECKVSPVLLVLEDLHWGDIATVQLVDRALRHLRDQPLMVLALARPDIDNAFPQLWSERHVQVMKLGPLSRKASEKLVRDALGDEVSSEMLARIIDRADGNPFYLQELIRAVASGRSDDFPDSILGMVQARLDAQEAEARRILRAGSVFGANFAKGGVTALLGHEAEASMDDWLTSLADQELISRTNLPGIDGEPEFTFSHALIREAAYSMLTDGDRALGHRLAGDWLERCGSTEAMVLAEHFFRGGEPGRSAPWFGRAAEQALEANDLAAAIERAKRAIGCGLAGPALGALHRVQAEAHVWRGEFSVGERKGQQAMEALPSGSAAWFAATSQTIVAAAKQGHLDRVEEYLARASVAAPELGALGAKVCCLAWACTYLLFGGRYHVADRWMERIAALAGDAANIEPQAVALVHQLRSIRASAAGDSCGCLHGFEEALVAFEAGGDRRNACAVRVNMGFALAELGDFVRAEEALRAGLAAADRMGLMELAAVALNNLGRVLGQRGQCAEAEQIERSAIEIFQKQGEPRFEGIARTYLAEIALAAGDLATAENEVRLATHILIVAPPLKAGALAVLSRVLLRQGRAQEALEASREAILQLEALGGMEEGEAVVRLAYAESLCATGSHEARTAIACARDRLLVRAAKIADSDFRQRFLCGVPDNARTLELALAWNAPPPTDELAAHAAVLH